MRKKMKRKPHTADYKFKVALEAIKGNKTVAELCEEYGIVSSQLHTWKKELLENGSEIFDKSLRKEKGQNDEIDRLHQTIGKLKVENDFLEKVLGKCR